MALANAHAPPSTALLEARELTKDFGGLRAVSDCSFRVETGSITSLIGPNGAGKTTVFNLISGLLKPTAGRVLFDGVDLTGRRPHQITRRGISRTFQLARELQDMSVLENMVVHSTIRGFAELLRGSVLAKERFRAMELLSFVGIDRLAEEPARKLSYGQRKLLELAAILMSEPRLILLDEPAGGVNPALLETIVDRIESLNREGRSFLIVEHNMDLVMQVSHSVVVMAHGEVLTQGPPDAVQLDEAVLDAYLGEA
jgi:neutral amino acid transport system ATP-binding protein